MPGFHYRMSSRTKCAKAFRGLGFRVCLSGYASLGLFTGTVCTELLRNQAAHLTCESYVPPKP